MGLWAWLGRGYRQRDDSLARVRPDLARTEIRAWRDLTTQIRVPSGFRLANAGDFGGEVYLVLDGAVGVVHEGTPIAVLGRGSVAGELGVALWSRRRVADLIALEPTSLAVATAGGWRMLLALAPRLAQSVEREADRRLLELAALDV
jgi:CRP-like cAMP-binding protein